LCKNNRAASLSTLPTGRQATGRLELIRGVNPYLPQAGVRILYKRLTCLPQAGALIPKAYLPQAD